MLKQHGLPFRSINHKVWTAPSRSKFVPASLFNTH